jgi:hypothetical protein
MRNREKKMMSINRSLSATLAMTALLAMLAGCDRQEGPAESAGKNVDNAMEKAGDKIEKAGENIQDAAKGNKP